jgi:hypothetical protein
MWNLWQSGFVQSLILESALFPAAVTMLMVVAAYYKTRKYPRWRSIIWGAAILGGFLGGYALIYRDFSFPLPDKRDQKSTGPTLFVGAVGLALVAPLSGSILLAQFGSALAVVLAVALVFSLLMRGSRWDSPSADVGVLILGTLMVDLRFYAGASMVVMVWLLVSLAAGAGVASILQHRGHSGHWTVLAPGLISSLPMAVAGWMALQTYLASGGGY